MQLTVAFLLGMGVNLIGVPDETTGAAKVVTSIALGLHVLVALGLLVVAALCLWGSGELTAAARNLALTGLVLTVVTIATGVLTLTTGSNWWSFVMAVGFIASFLVYGRLLLKPTG
jgi:hypothetical protein